MNFDKLFVESYRPIRPGSTSSLQGFATIRVPEIGMDIRGIGYHKRDEYEWLEMPCRMRRKPDGSFLRIYTLRFIDTSDWAKFKQMTIEALRKFHEPGE